MADDTEEFDFLDELLEERTAKNPAFPAMVEEAYQRRLILKEIAEVHTGAHGDSPDASEKR